MTTKRKAVTFLTLLACLAVLPGVFAKNCHKGKPCGNSCININYTCHVGNSTTTQTPKRQAKPQPPSTLYAFQAGALPNPALTPGDVLSTDVNRICTPGYSKSVREVPESLKGAVYREYGITTHAPYEYEIDHLVSLEIGGSNSILNLWPESYKTHPINSRVKDRLEDKLHELVCSGQLDISQAQREEAENWIQAYTKYVGPLPTQ